ncbi:hypothetical protein EGW69_12055 [Enterococcus faecium]|jgi:uncharacterized protein YpmB|uniref:hypothetical protein n=1 Tax=Enterococcus TaxID=1350 RepID=UPI000354304E|nr:MULTISPECIES: hypothetical protein [Enterococcus]EME7174862.1 hypothetical protein [Enterococcus faecium]EPI26418.1 hypothetical protein D352_00022 [Enterococcus faecium LA4B-2]PCE00303.1 hypothetical protein CKY11_09235 [Enterococcus hirae]PCE08307.1 hypothetical protein CKY13_03385 [Enterococcus hirae]PQC47061.1 hypothetical protein CUM94_08675 [Enterococcus faecium]
MIIISGIILLIIGACLGYQVAYFPKFKELQQRRAIQAYFNLKSNDYTYFYEGVEDSYILSVENQEYRIKFSMNNPIKVVYAVELEMSSDEMVE